MGGDPKAWNDWQGAWITLAYDYWIARYPVTVAQYACFVDAGGYTDRTCWTATGWAWRQKEKIAQPKYWQDAQWHLANHPVEGASWYEAQAYTQWLQQQRQAGALALPGEVLLPVMCCGYHGKWSGRRRRGTRMGGAILGAMPTTVVPRISMKQGYERQIQPGADDAGGPYGQDREGNRAEDLSGNVWEWCQTVWAVKYQEREDNRAEGSFCCGFSAAGVVRRPAQCPSGCNGYTPDLRGDELGFRVVVSVPITSR